MSIESAILGILSWKSATGYELKKIFEDSSFMHWSGNNNQIYKALVRLKESGLVTSETVMQEDSPSKKIYTLTDAGRARLKEFALSAPGVPECRKPFLIQLAWADILSGEELDGLVGSYQKEIALQLAMEHEKIRRRPDSPGRTDREILLWDMIEQNILSSLNAELLWAKKLRQKLLTSKEKEDKNIMNYKIITKNELKYVELFSAPAPLKTEADALDVVALCGENGTNLLMVHREALSDDFFDLKTRAAGGIIQKFVNYRVKAVIVIPEDAQGARFKEWAGESNKGNQFGVFPGREEAEKWLLE